MEYKVIENVSISFFEKAINEEIRKGWEPIGGVSYNRYKGYFQAIVKR